ncbi:MutS-related protein [Filimonas effusa]|uniref:DNA mismatch repair protein n=1 Tax=Filimonas effusa TaxID=2508721 RepID=A0A4Q1D7Z0_9BACT|nr:DNA mismatch repair protein [Filimonas effusa]RXK85412.1 DNA mismatch repair protein [Filimonas effusa]
MSFITDKQTLEDLGLMGKYRQHSIYTLFNQVKTAGGERLLREMFHHPLSNAAAINERSSVFRYFQENAVPFPLEQEAFNLVESYLSNSTGSNILSCTTNLLRKKLMALLVHDEQYSQFLKALQATIRAVHSLYAFTDKLDIPQLSAVKNILSDPRLSSIATGDEANNLTLLKAAGYDHLLRNTMQQDMELLLEKIYELDVYIAVGAIARKHQFSYAIALPASQQVFSAPALRHPGLPAAVPNVLHMDAKQNLLFLTGANMAGKSTFMKSVGITLYLAHMGFPVAAGDMRFSVRDGIYTSINVPDSLDMGYSHFYAEVLRVKKVAKEVAAGRNMVVIFDELFKGTNVKDAYDATLAVTAAFSRYRNCLFIISTHIIEAGEALQQSCFNIRFAKLPTIMNGNVPSYTYTLTEGITSDRHGMTIIENEKIIDLLHMQPSQTAL